MDLVQVWTRLPVERVETSRRDLPVSSCYWLSFFSSRALTSYEGEQQLTIIRGGFGEQ